MSLLLVVPLLVVTVVGCLEAIACRTPGEVDD